MPDIPTYRRKITARPVGKAPIPVVDTAAGAVGAGLGNIGRGIGDVGEVLFQIKREQLDLNDAINAVKANAFIESEKKNFATLIEDTDPKVREDGPSDWEVSSAKSFTEMRKNISTLQFTGRRRRMMEAQLDALEEMRADEIRKAQSDYLVRQARGYLQQNLHDALVSNDPLMVEAAMGLFEMNKKHAWGNDTATADAVYRETIREGRKEFYIDQSRLFPEEVIAEMRERKKALGRGGKDKDGLGAKDFDDVIASAYMAKNLQDSALDEQQEADRDKLGRALYDGTITYAMINSSSLDEKEQESYRLKMNTEAERLARGETIKVNQDVQSQLEMEATSIWTGAVSKESVLKKAHEARFPADGKPLIDDAGYARITNIASTAYKSYQMSALQDGAQAALKQLVVYDTPDSLDSILSSIDRQFSGKEAKTQREKVLTDRQLQFQNYTWYKQAMKDYIKDHPEADADAIRKQSDALIREYRQRTSDDIRALIGQQKLPSKEVIDESAALKTKGAFIPDDTRLYIEPPPLQGKIKNWMSLPESRRRDYWEKYEAGKPIPNLPVPESDDEKEMGAYDMIYEVWGDLPENVRGAVEIRARMKEPYSKIIKYDEVAAVISKGAKK